MVVCVGGGVVNTFMNCYMSDKMSEVRFVGVDQFTVKCLTDLEYKEPRTRLRNSRLQLYFMSDNVHDVVCDVVCDVVSDIVCGGGVGDCEWW